ELPRHVLPQPFDMLRVLPDQAPGALLERIGKTAFTNTSDSRVCLDGHHGIGLIEQRVRIGWRISPYARNLHLRERGLQQRKMRERIHPRGHRFQKESSVHHISFSQPLESAPLRLHKLEKQRAGSRGKRLTLAGLEPGLRAEILN